MLGGDDRMRGRRAAPPTHAGRQPPFQAAPDRSTRKPLASMLCGAAAGFLLGSAFWIGLGVQELTGGAETSSSREPHGVQFPAPGCTSLTLDRREGNTIAEPCLGEALPMREARARSLDRASLP